MLTSLTLSEIIPVPVDLLDEPAATETVTPGAAVVLPVVPV